MFKKILAIDTSMDGCSVSLLKNNLILNKFQLCKKKHTEIILPMIKEILSIDQTNINELNALACSTGPGNFTGVRLSICIAQALACENGLPLIGVSTFASLAEQAWRKYTAKKVLIAFDAKKKGIYWAEYVKNFNGIWKRINTESYYKIDDIKNKIKELSGTWITVGNGWEKINVKKTKKMNLIFTNITRTNSKDMIMIAKSLLKKNKNLYFEKVIPIYLNDISSS